MKKIRLTLSIIATMYISTILGQQDPHYTQYMYTMNILNPAYAGSKGHTSIGLLGRTQWVGVEGAPRSITLSVHSPLGDNGIGVGLSAIRNEIGPVKEDNLFADFSYTIDLSQYGKLAFGLKAGVNFLNVNNFSTIDPDPLNVPINEALPNFGLGTFYYTDKFYFGLSASNILQNRFLEESSGIASTASQSMHYFMASGYVFDIFNDLRLKPSFLLKGTSGAPVSIDLFLNLFVEDRVELGLGHSIDNSISAMAAIQANETFKVGYSYEYSTTNFGRFNSGSHEIILLFDLNRTQSRRLRCF